MTLQKSRIRSLLHPACAVVVALLALYLQIGDVLENLLGLGGPAGELSIVISALIALVAVVVFVTSALVVALARIVKGKVSRVGLRTLGYSFLILAFTAIGFALGVKLDKVTEGRLAEQGRPLVVAVKAFTSERGRPPLRLEDLRPNFIADIPVTRLAHYPRFEIITCTTDKEDCFGDSWILRAEALESRALTRGSGGCDRYVFAPSGRYPTRETDTICHYGTFADGWAYEYGD